MENNEKVDLNNRIIINKRRVEQNIEKQHFKKRTSKK